MPTQFQIEKAVGIDKETAEFIMNSNSPNAKGAMSTLKLCVDRFETCAFALLKCYVEDCKKEMKGSI